jgi:hypothetical protein
MGQPACATSLGSPAQGSRYMRIHVGAQEAEARLKTSTIRHVESPDDGRSCKLSRLPDDGWCYKDLRMDVGCLTP